VTATKRVVYVEGNVDGTIGGSYFSLLFLVTALDRSRFDPRVVFAADNELRQRFHDAGVPTMVRPPPRPFVVRTPVARLIGKAVNLLQGALLEPLRIATLLRRERIDLVHLNNSIVRNHSWVIAARIAGIPCITHERGINPQFKTRDRKLARRLAAVICISAAVHDNFVRLGLGNLKLVTIHNGLDPAETRVTRDAADVRRELGIATEARIVGMVGNIKPWKGQEVVIRAIGQLRDRFPDVVCLLIGDTSPDDAPYRRTLDALLATHDLANHVIITGFKRDVANYINGLSVQIHASIAPEPFGRVLLEGMALGKPLVASNGGAVPEIVVDRETGLVFEPGNAEELADRVATLLEDPPLASRYGAAGRARLESAFSIAHNAERTQALYDRVLTMR
jgi:glycosyltransferase involved in cell wall biosynthesis